MPYLQNDPMKEKLPMSEWNGIKKLSKTELQFMKELWNHPDGIEMFADRGLYLCISATPTNEDKELDDNMLIQKSEE